MLSCLLFAGIYGKAAEAKTSSPQRDSKVDCVASHGIVSNNIVSYRRRLLALVLVFTPKTKQSGTCCVTLLASLTLQQTHHVCPFLCVCVCVGVFILTVLSPNMCRAVSRSGAQ